MFVSAATPSWNVVGGDITSLHSESSHFIPAVSFDLFLEKGSILASKRVKVRSIRESKVLWIVSLRALSLKESPISQVNTKCLW